MAKRRRQKLNFKRLQRTCKAFLRFGLRILPFGVIFGFAYFIFLNARYMVHADPYFHVEKVTVFPSGILTSPELKFLEDEVRGQSLLEVDLRKISKGLERNPKIKRAEVSRTLPGSLNVFLAERAPLFQVQLEPGGKFFLISDDQMILSKTDSPKPNFMVLEDFTSDRKFFSTGAFYPNKHFPSLLNFFEALKSDSILSHETVSKMSIDQIGNIGLLLSDGIELKIGKQMPTAEGTRAVLGSLLHSSQQRSQILYLDLRYRDIIVKKKTDS